MWGVLGRAEARVGTWASRVPAVLVAGGRDCRHVGQAGKMGRESPPVGGAGTSARGRSPGGVPRREGLAVGGCRSVGLAAAVLEVGRPRFGRHARCRVARGSAGLGGPGRGVWAARSRQGVLGDHGEQRIGAGVASGATAPPAASACADWGVWGARGRQGRGRRGLGGACCGVGGYREGVSNEPWRRGRGRATSGAAWRWGRRRHVRLRAP